MKRKLAIAVLVTFQLNILGAFADTGKHNPRPRPTPTPTQQPNPAVNTGPAQQAGLADGQAPGAREGQERGAQEGRKAGLDRGFHEGFDKCSRELSQRAYDQGFAQGDQQGQNQGMSAGQAAGQQDGDRDGQAAGTTDGQNRADSDANTAATPAGTQAGINDANQSDASTKGQTDGTAAGDQAALQQAKSVDYQRGRDAYKNDQFNAPVQTQDSFSQKPAPAAAAAALHYALAANGIHVNLGQADRADGHGNDHPSPDFRYYNPTKTYPTPAETTAYQQGYRQGYINGFNQAYGQSFQQYFPGGEKDGQRQGCERAHEQNYDASAQQGFNDGQKKGYSDAFHQAHDIAYHTAYNLAFQQASQNAYQASYQADYQNHYNQAHAAAYQQQYGQIYQSSFDAAKTQKYNQVYPTYAAQQYQQGQQDEAQDFQLRPVRLIDAQITGTTQSGLLEPGEALRIKLTLRNFSDQTISAKDVKLAIQAQDSSGSVVTIPTEVLVQDLKPKSLTTVTDALEIRFTESAVGQGPKSFVVSASYQDRDVGDQSVQGTAQFMMGTAIASQPTLHEGMKSTIDIQVTNNSQIASDDGTIVTLNSDPSEVQVLQPQQKIGPLKPGQSTVVKFPVIGRADADSVNLPIGVSVTLADGRRVGLLDTSAQTPVENDYRIEIDGSQSGLRQAGITRVGYTITNDGSRLTYKGLQLKITVLGSNASNFQVLGPNPQYLEPLEQGKSITFFVPVLASAANAGATLQLEVQEDGRTVEIHQVAF